MTHRPLHYFLEVARTGSIRAAAESAHVAGSAISRHIQIFETMTGTPLFERHARGMTLTPAGEIFSRYARAVIMESEKAQAEIEDLKGLRRGHLRLCAIDGIVSGPLSGLIAAFRATNPGITIQLRSMGTESVMNAIRDGEADIGIAFHTSPLQGVTIAKRFADPLRVAVASSHDLARRKTMRFTEAIRYPLALPEHSFGIRKLLDAACHAHGAQPNLVLETNSIEALRGFARSGAGITFLPHLSVRRELSLGSLVEIVVNDPILSKSSTDICVREHHELSAAAKAFLHAISAEFTTVLANETVL